MRTSERRWRKIGAAFALAGAIAVLLAGAAAIKWYVWDIAIGQAGEPDRSMLFWGIPVVFIGGGALAAGVAVVRPALRSLRG